MLNSRVKNEQFAKAAKPLAFCAGFFSYLNAEGVRYCHWKSNLGLEKALRGYRDLDLLIDEADRERFNQALLKFDFKEIISPPGQSYPGMEDYLGFDRQTGRLVHLHIHYQLVLGRQYAKDYHLPIEDFILNNLSLSGEVYVPVPELELLLLMIRANMKFDLAFLIKQILKGDYRFYPKAISDEFDFLLKNYQPDKFKEILSRIKLPLSVEPFLRFIKRLEEQKLRLLDVLELRSYIFKSLKPFCRGSTLLCLLKSYVYLFFRPVRKKVLKGIGKAFAVVGAPGSGKTTLTEGLKDWLVWKLTVKRYYLGIPKSRVSQGIIRSPGIFRSQSMEFLKKQASSLRWIIMAWYRFRIYRKFRSLTASGGVAIIDRYPLSVFKVMAKPMDGPRIRKEQGQKAKTLARLEESYYSQIDLPDKVFVLQVDIAELCRRRNRTASELSQKVEIVNRIENSEIFDIINGNLPYRDVLLDIKRKVWEVL